MRTGFDGHCCARAVSVAAPPAATASAASAARINRCILRSASPDKRPTNLLAQRENTTRLRAANSRTDAVAAGIPASIDSPRGFMPEPSRRHDCEDEDGFRAPGRAAAPEGQYPQI